MYRRFGSQVTIIEKGARLIQRDDEDVSQTVKEIMENEGINIRLNAACMEVKKRGEDVAVRLDCAGPRQKPFDVTRHIIPLKEIRDGGPPKNGIPALSNPRFVSAKEGNKFLIQWDRVLGVEYHGVAKAYPIKILNWHEVVNDTIADKPLMVSW